MSAPELYRGSFDRTAIGATVLLLMMESDGTYPSVSLSHLPDRDMRADPFTCVIFPPRSYFFVVVVCYGRAWKSSTMIEPTLQG